MGFPIVSLVVRAFQLIFAAVVLGLSVTLVKHQTYGKAPATTGYSAFVGGWGLVAAAIGLAASFISAIPWLIIVGLDALSSLISLAGGIAMVLAVRGITCTANLDNVNGPNRGMGNKIFSGGCTYSDEYKQDVCGIGYPIDKDADDFKDRLQDNADIFKGRCTRAQADYVFMYLAFALFLISVGVTFFARRRSGGSKMVV